MSGEKKYIRELDQAAADAVKVIAAAVDKAATVIATSALEAQKLLASSAAEAVKVVATSASNQAQTLHENTKGDHDLIVILGVKMDGVKKDIEELNLGTTKRIDLLETTKLNLADSYLALYKKDVDAFIKDHTEKLEWQRDKIITIATWGAIFIFLVSVAEPFVLRFWK